MSRGQSQSGSQFGRRVLERCKNKSNIENVVVIDVDLVTEDAPETSHVGSRGLRQTRKNIFSGDAINIDDDEDTDETARNAHGVGTNKIPPESNNSPSAEESDSDDCLILLRKGNFPPESAKKVGLYCKNGSSRNRFGLDLTSESSVSGSNSSNCTSGSSESDSSETDSYESNSSESDSSDCEIVEDSSGNIREQWEKAAMKRRTLVKDRFGSEDPASTFRSCDDPISSSPGTSHDKVDAEKFTNKIYSNYCEDVPIENSQSNGKENSSPSSHNADVHTGKPPLGTSAFGPCTDALSSSPETTHDRMDEENFTSKIYSNNHEDVPVENNPSDSSNGKENTSSGVPTDDNVTVKPPLETDVNVSSQVPTGDKVTEESPLKTNANTCVADSDHIYGVYVKPGFQNKETASEKCSHEAQTTDETFCYHKEADLRDTEVPLQGPSSCNSSMEGGNHGTGSFYEKDQPSREPSHGTESCCNLNVDHDVFCFQEKEKPIFEPSLWNNQLFNGPELNVGRDCHSSSIEAMLGEPICNYRSGSGTTEMGCSSDKESEDLNVLHEDLIGERERHKESDEYRRAAEEEWASRMQQLQIQANEAQRLRRKRKAERLLLDTERRQKQRVEEIRESQRRDEETIYLKEKHRAEVRKELDLVELRYRDMASLLRGLGIHVDGGAYPMPREVNAAYRRALLKFHPDRSSRMDIRQQVEAEEKFKLISRLKEQLLPVR